MAISTEIRCQSTRKSPLLHTGPISIYLFHPGSANNCNDVNPLQDSLSTPCVWHRCLWSLRAGDVGGLLKTTRTPRHPWSQDLSIRNRSFAYGKRPWSLWGLQTAIDQWISHLNCWSLGLNHPKAKCKGSNETFKLNNELSYLPVPTGYRLDWS